MAAGRCTADCQESVGTVGWDALGREGVGEAKTSTKESTDDLGERRPIRQGGVYFLGAALVLVTPSFSSTRAPARMPVIEMLPS